MSKSWSGLIHIDSPEDSECFVVKTKYKNMSPKDAVNIVASVFSSLNLPISAIPTIVKLATMQLEHIKECGGSLDTLIDIDVEGFIKQLADAKFEEWIDNNE
jgi:hypothetical protein